MSWKFKLTALLLTAAPVITLSQTLAISDTKTAPDPPITVTLQDALDRARAYSPEFHAALTELGIAHEDKVQSRASLLPSVNYNSQFIYTQPAPGNAPRFIANNGVREYIALGNAHQSLDPASFALYRRTVALEAATTARAQIATRGLVVTVTQVYYGFVVAQRKYSTAQQAATEAGRFFDISRKLEKGGEVAHADTIKARLQANDKERDLREAVLAMEKARVDLAILIFPDFNQNFTTVDDLRLPDNIPGFDEVTRLASSNNSELAVALALVKAGDSEVKASRAAYFPTLGLDYNYGIDASRFALRTDGESNLGYSAAVTFNLPIWNWGSTHSKVKQSILRRDQSRLELNFVQKKLLGQLKVFYTEAQTALSELDLLRNSAQLAADSLHLTTLRYQSGEATVLEVVDAQNTLTMARNTFDDAEVRYRTSLSNLQTLTGKF
ncbi:MAG: outer rane efflux protein [Acidobacteriales bacterium]|nr:outer rane efflux protein [Terriglobales bacterium]